MPSSEAITLRAGLLSGDIDGTELQSRLTTESSQLAAFTELCNARGSFEAIANSSTALPEVLASAAARSVAVASPVALRVMASSTYATGQLVTTANGALLFAEVLKDTTGGRYSHWRNIAVNYTRLKSYVNAAGSKLKRQLFTGSGTWTAPATTLAWSAFAGGAGGGGGIDGSGGGGGGGGALVTVNFASSIPSTNQSVTIPSGGTADSATQASSTTIGSIVTAVGGFGSTTTAAGAGGGTTAGGGYLAMSDIDVNNAAWQAINATQAGGAGGAGNIVANVLGAAGSDGFPRTGGAPGFVTPNTLSQPGTAFGGGGGGACDTAGITGNSAAANSCAGGSGARTSGAGTGGSGYAVIYWLEG